MSTTYCNTTTHLRRAYSEIDRVAFKGLKVIKGYKPHTTAGVYKLSNCGFVEAMYEGDVKMTEAASIVAVDAAQEWYYDSTNDVLYFYPTGNSPDNFTYRAGEDIADVKTHCIQVASREAESLLDKDTPIPVPRSLDGTSTDPWDVDFAHAVAQIACGHIIARIMPVELFASGEVREGNVAGALLAAGRKTIQEYADHTRKFSWEITGDEIAGASVRAASSNTSLGFFQLRGSYTGEDDAFWKVKISTGGALGTAYYQLSTDNGTTYGTAVVTANTWVELTQNVWIRFIPVAGGATDFILNDTWQLEMTSSARKVSSSGVKSIPLVV